MLTKNEQFGGIFKKLEQSKCQPNILATIPKSSSIVFYKLTLFSFFGLRTEMGKAISDKPLIETLLWNKDSPEKN